MCVSVNIGKIWGLDPILKPLPECDKYLNILIYYTQIYSYFRLYHFLDIHLYQNIRIPERNL